MPSPFVLVVGSINVDLVVRAPRLPQPGETVTGGLFERHGGGKGANQAVAAARCGAEVCFVGAVGDDDLGEEAIGGLAQEGIEVSRIGRLADTATGVALIVVDESGENQIAVASGANRALDATLVSQVLQGIRAPGEGVFLANLEISDETVLAGARFAKAAGLQLVINPAPARPLREELVALGPILTPNRVEAELLTGNEDPGVAGRALQALTGAPVIVTLGGQGAVLMEGQATTAFPAHPAEVVDTTGAGDAFNGVLAAELARARPLVEALEWAMAAAAISVGMPGAREGMPDADRLRDFVERKPLLPGPSALPPLV